MNNEGMQAQGPIGFANYLEKLRCRRNEYIAAALAQAQQQYPPGFVSSYEQANANHCGMSGASPLDSLLGPGLL